LSLEITPHYNSLLLKQMVQKILREFHRLDILVNNAGITADAFYQKGIRVNAVAPGFIMTEMTAKVPENVLKLMVEKTPLGRLGKPADVAATYLFLASDEAAYITDRSLGSMVVW